MNDTTQKENAAALLDYLRGAKELEWNSYTIKQLGDSIRARISAYSKRRDEALSRTDTIRKRTDSLQAEIGSLKSAGYPRSSYKFNFEMTGGGCLVSILIWGLITAACIWLGEGRGISSLLFPLHMEQAFASLFGKFFGVLVHFVAFPIVVYIILLLILELCRSARYNRKEEVEEAEFLKKEQQRAEKRRTELQKEIDEGLAQIPELEAQAKEIEAAVLPDLSEELRRNTEAAGSAAKALEEYYGAGVIHPKYQGLVPVTTICEYFETGRCTALSGFEGAYNLYESEYRLNMINARLDTIQKQLQHISMQNASIQRAITGMNDRIAGLMDSVDECIDRNRASAAAIGAGQAAPVQSTQLSDFYASSASASLRHLDRMASLEYYSRHMF